MSYYAEVKKTVGGVDQQFASGAVRDQQKGKGRYDLLPFYAINRLAKLYEAGAERYAPENWRKGIPLRRYLDSALRHLSKFAEGYRDEDHAAAVMWNIACLIETGEMVRRGLLPVSLIDLPDYTEPNGGPGKTADDEPDGPFPTIDLSESDREKDADKIEEEVLTHGVHCPADKDGDTLCPFHCGTAVSCAMFQMDANGVPFMSAEEAVQGNSFFAVQIIDGEDAEEYVPAPEDIVVDAVPERIVEGQTYVVKPPFPLDPNGPSRYDPATRMYGNVREKDVEAGRVYQGVEVGGPDDTEVADPYAGFFYREGSIWAESKSWRLAGDVVNYYNVGVLVGPSSVFGPAEFRTAVDVGRLVRKGDQ